MTEQTGLLETKEDIGTDQQATVKLWAIRIESARKRDEKWRKRALKVLDVYRDKRDEGAEAKFNVLWSNVETLRPALYIKTPKPDVRRRFRDKDPIGKAIAEIEERALSYSADAYDFDDVMDAAIEDYLLPGRGQARVRYVPTMNTVTPQTRVEGSIQGEGEDAKTVYPDNAKFDSDGAYIEGEPYDEVVYEEVRCEYTPWEDFLVGECRRWEDAPWVAFRGRPTREELVAEIGELGREVPLTLGLDGMDKDAVDDNGEVFKRAETWEIWDRVERKVLLICPDYKDKPLKEIDDPLRLRGFFPCPRPMYSVRSTSTMEPIPEYCLYQDQADELNKITRRIDALVGALKVRGVYDASQEEMANLLEAPDNKMIAVADWMGLIEKGGLKNIVAMMPLDVIAACIKELYLQREQVKQVIYEVTGISDIIRGATDPRETLGAQKIKGNFANLRLEKRRAEVNRFIRDIFRLKAEVIAEHFSAETLKLMTGVELPEPDEKAMLMQAKQAGMPLPPAIAGLADKPTWDEAMQIMKQDGPRDFRVDVETDSTIMTDAAEEQQAATEFLTGVTGYLTNIAPAVQSGAVPIETAKTILMAAARRFKFGPEVEDALDMIGMPTVLPGAPQGAPGEGAGAPGGAPQPGAPAAEGEQQGEQQPEMPPAWT